MDPDERFEMNEQARAEARPDYNYFNNSKIEIMNAKRRKTINDLKDKIESLKTDLEAVLDEEADYRDNVPENLQESDRFYASEAAIEKLEEAVDQIGDAIINLEEIE